MIDIAVDEVEAKDYKETEDPRKVRSEKAGRGPLAAGWQQSASPIMTCYKMVTAEYKQWGLQTRVENLIVTVCVPPRCVSVCVCVVVAMWSGEFVEWSEE